MISDTHGRHKNLNVPPDIDIVIHSGDASVNRLPALNEPEYYRFLNWYSNLYIPVKVLIGGNHDTALESGMIEIPEGIIYLYNELVSIDGMTIYGSPFSPKFGDWSFMLDRLSQNLKDLWALIPTDVDILVTHTPPYGILDDMGYKRVGCEVLSDRLQDLNVGIHQFGHIHEQCGQIHKGKYDQTIYVNATTTDLGYNLINDGVILNYEYYDE